MGKFYKKGVLVNFHFIAYGAVYETEQIDSYSPGPGEVGMRVFILESFPKAKEGVEGRYLFTEPYYPGPGERSLFPPSLVLFPILALWGLFLTTFLSG